MTGVTLGWAAAVLGILTIVGLGQNHLANKQLWDDNRQLHLNTERKLMALQEDKLERVHGILAAHGK